MPAETPVTSTTGTISHWSTASSSPATPQHCAGHQPGHRCGHRAGGAGFGRRRSAVIDSRRRRSRGATPPGPSAHRDPVQLPRAASTAAASEPALDHRQNTARCSPTPSARWAAARKWPNSPATSRISSRAVLRTSPPVSTCIRCASPRPDRHHLAVQLSAMVPMWFFPIAPATGQHRGDRRARRIRRRPLRMARTVERGRPPDGVFNVLQGRQDRCRHELLTNPEDQVDQLSCRVHPDRAACVRHRNRFRQACAALGGARNHAIALPTPISTRPLQRW